jgi:hypothetical protein
VLNQNTVVKLPYSRKFGVNNEAKATTLFWITTYNCGLGWLLCSYEGFT